MDINREMFGFDEIHAAYETFTFQFLHLPTITGHYGSMWQFTFKFDMNAFRLSGL